MNVVSSLDRTDARLQGIVHGALVLLESSEAVTIRPSSTMRSPGSFRTRNGHSVAKDRWGTVMNCVPTIAFEEVGPGTWRTGDGDRQEHRTGRESPGH